MMKQKIHTLIHVIVFLALATGIIHAQEKSDIEVADITFEGISAFSEKRIQNLMVTEKSSFFNRSYYDRQVLEADIEAIETFYHDQGYLDAEVRNYESQADEDSTSVHITIYIDEKEPTKVVEVEFSGNESVRDEELMEHVTIRPGTIYRRTALSESRVSIITYYGTLGFPETEVEPSVDIDSEKKQVSVLFDINENSKFIIDEIRIEGLDKTQKYIIERETGFERGDTINQSRLLESQRRIYETGLFSSVYIYPAEPASGKEGTKDVIIELEEKDSIRMNISAGYDTEEELRGKLEGYTINLMGTGRKLGLSGRISFIRRSLSSSYTSPRLFGTKWQMDINTGWHFLDEPGYDLRKIFGKMSFGRRIGNHTLFRTQFRQDYSVAENIQLTTIPEHTKNNISSIELSLRHDRRNSLFNATQGIYWELTTEIGGNFYKQTNTFLRSVGRIKYYYSLNRFTVLATSLEMGSLSSKQRLVDIPLHERFYSGGGNSIRGYEYNKVGPLDEHGKPLGGKLMLTWNIIEVRRRIYKILHMVVFSDAGSIWKNSDTFDIADIRTSAGLGLRLDTPVGVIRVDYGYKLDRKKDETPGKFYISMGQAF